MRSRHCQHNENLFQAYSQNCYILKLPSSTPKLAIKYSVETYMYKVAKFSENKVIFPSSTSDLPLKI